MMNKMGMILCAVVGMSGHSFAQSILIQVGSSASKTVNLVSTDNGQIYGLANPTSGWSWTDTNSSGNPIAQVSLYNQAGTGDLIGTQFDTDPSIHYAMGVSNDTNATQNYSMTFNLNLPTGMTLTAGEVVTVSSSVSGSVSDSSSNDATDGVTIGLGTNPFIQQVYLGPTDLASSGVDLLSAPLTFIPAPTTPFGPFPATNAPNTTTVTVTAAEAAAGTISVVTNFSLSAYDSASFSGKFVVTPPVDTTVVPEPSADALLLAGLGVLVIAVRRRWRSGN